METLLQYQITWWDFLVITIGLGLAYLLLRFLNRMLRQSSFLGRWQGPLSRTVQLLLLLYEPLAILVLSTTYVLINPILHGLLFALLLLLGFTQMRNYLNGTILQLSNRITVGQRIKAGELKGVIAEIGRLGLYIKTSKGLHYLGYSQLLNQGYTLTSGEEIGGFYQLHITAAESDQPALSTHQLMDLLTTAPYLDWNHKPQLKVNPNQPKQVHARLVVQEERHLYQLMSLIKEWGYECQLNR